MVLLEARWSSCGMTSSVLMTATQEPSAESPFQLMQLEIKCGFQLSSCCALTGKVEEVEEGVFPSVVRGGELTENFLRAPAVMLTLMEFQQQGGNAAESRFKSWCAQIQPLAHRRSLETSVNRRARDSIAVVSVKMALCNSERQLGCSRSNQAWVKRCAVFQCNRSGCARQISPDSLDSQMKRGPQSL